MNSTHHLHSFFFVIVFLHTSMSLLCLFLDGGNEDALRERSHIQKNLNTKKNWHVMIGNNQLPHVKHLLCTKFSFCVKAKMWHIAQLTSPYNYWFSKNNIICSYYPLVRTSNFIHPPSRKDLPIFICSKIIFSFLKIAIFLVQF